jgi:hypothetical protein
MRFSCRLESDILVSLSSKTPDQKDPTAQLGFYTSYPKMILL